PDKVRKVSPWQYLGLKITKCTVTPQSLVINDNPRTPQELQLCGSISWVRPRLGISTEDLTPLFNLLRGSNDLTSPRSLTEEARASVRKVQETLSSRQAHRSSHTATPNLPFPLAILRQVPHLHVLLCQWDDRQKDPLIIIEWVFLPHQSSKSIRTPQELMAQLIMKARACLRTLAGCDLSCIYLPVISDSLEHLLQNNVNLQYALDSYPGRMSVQYPKHKLFNSVYKLIPKHIQSLKLLKALTVFTDGSVKSHKSVMTWRNPQMQKWQSDVEVVHGSPQVAELAAAVRAFERYKEPFKLITDSAYV
ncbi:POK11 protein, partial [Climacteris rufus]|nr:POK11 protein [Climacteris rufus]